MSRATSKRKYAQTGRCRSVSTFAMSSMLLAMAACEQQVIDFPRVADPWPAIIQPRRALLDGEFLFFEDGQPQQLHACAKHDCEATRRTFGYQSSPIDFGNPASAYSFSSEDCMAVNQDALFYADGGLSYWPATTSGPSSEPVLIDGYTKCTGLAADDENIYRADSHSTIIAFSTSGDHAGRIVAFASVEASSRFLVQQQYLYWANLTVDPGIYRVRKDGASQPELVVAGGVTELAADESRLYWIDASATTLASCDASDCATTTQVLATGLSFPGDLRIKNGTAFWLESVPGLDDGRFLRSCPSQGCPSGSSIALGDMVAGYAVDDTTIYGIVKVAESSGPLGPLYRIREYPRE